MQDGAMTPKQHAAQHMFYLGRRVETNGNPNKPIVKVFANSCFLYPLHVTTSLDLAMRWIEANPIKKVS
jgi:hypothetical protein